MTFLKNLFLNIILRSVANLVKNFGLMNLNHIMIVIGKAFGPDGIRHFSELSTTEQHALQARVPVLKTNHDDFPKPFRWVPRTVDCWVGKPGPIIDGNTSSSAHPIPEPGHWFVSRGYFALTLSNHWHIRAGFRYDDIDDYITLSFTVKKV